MRDVAKPRPLSFTVLTLNTHKGFTYFNRRFVLHELREAVRAVSADVVFLQEVLGGHAHPHPGHPDWPVAPQYEFLADSIWPDFAYGRNAVYPKGHHGNALLSKFPIVRYRNHDISVGFRHERRGLLHCVLRVPGPELEVHAICAHLGLIEAHRRRQLELLGDLVDGGVPRAAPLLVAGDFNDWRMLGHRYLYRRSGLREVFVETHGRPPRSFPALCPLLRLDRIYFRNAELRRPARLSTRPWSHLSDHVPLHAEVRL
ncbi:MAG: endonuclease/exonuclease/phosphatase family protein [Gammaproteobacteria bacterium]|nr:endonuclease/exonuclease/phosphatase family protein [Gammaproteobacteria bacterium]